MLIFIDFFMSQYIHDSLLLSCDKNQNTKEN